MQEVCHKYWPDSGMMRVGEFLVDTIHVEELLGFVIRSFSLCPEKVDTAVVFNRKDCFFPAISLLVGEGLPGVSDPCDLLDARRSVLQSQSHCGLCF